MGNWLFEKKILDVSRVTLRIVIPVKTGIQKLKK